MDKKAITLQQLEEALRDLTRWIRDKLKDYMAEPTAEGESGWVLTTNGIGGRSWEPIDGLETDSTLSVEGAAADAAAAGAAIAAAQAAADKAQTAADKAQTAATAAGEAADKAQAAADAPVTTEKLADGAVTGDKLAAEVHGRFSAYNLLDNSSFRAQYAIAQAGVNGRHGSDVYCLDRWKSLSTSAARYPNYTRFTSTAQSGRVIQQIQNIAGHQITVAAKINAASTCYVGVYYTVGETTGSVAAHATSINGILCATGTVPADATDIAFRIYPAYVDGGGSANVYWAALYKGEYTKDTLPEYQPKGYAAELAECKRYYQRSYVSTPTGGSSVCVCNVAPSAYSAGTHYFPVEMRTAPTLTLYAPTTGASGCVTRWSTDENVTALSNVTQKGFHVRSNSGAFAKGEVYICNYEACADL